MGLGISPQAWGTVSTGLSAGGVASSAIGAYASAAGTRAQASIDDTNARLSELGAQAALLQGQHQEQVSRINTAELKSGQRVGFAAHGVDLGSDSAQRALTTTDLLGEVDANTAHANAIRAAFGYRTQALNSEMAAAGKRAINPVAAGFSTLVGGGAQVARSWYTLNKNLTATPPPSNSEPDYQYGGVGP